MPPGTSAARAAEMASWKTVCEREERAFISVPATVLCRSASLRV